MATIDLSENRSTRSDMALAAFEIAVNGYALAFDLDRRWSRLRPMASDLRAAALLFELLKKYAESERPIDGHALENLGELFNAVAMKIHELVDLAREFGDSHTLKAAVLAGRAEVMVADIVALTDNCAAILGSG